MKKPFSFFVLSLALFTAFNPLITVAATTFNPHFIISDPELEDKLSWSRQDIQAFLDSKGSYLRTYVAPDANGVMKQASDIIYEAAQTYNINPKYILVTLQKEQSLITDDAPTQKQLDWAAGYGVCDSCSMEDPKVLKFKGFGKQVDNTAGIMRWYYNNTDKSYVKKKDTPIRIDETDVTPQSWATAFLYTYTPHLHGNRNFWRIWNTWFEQIYPNSTLLVSKETGDFWLIQNNTRRRFKNRSALITRTDPKNAVLVSEIELSNYKEGSEITLPNYSLIRSQSGTYLIDYDSLRPFASEDVIGKLGFNPQEVVDVDESELAGYVIGTPITASSTAPLGVIYQVTDLKDTYYLLKDNVLYPITNKLLLKTNYSHLSIEKKKVKDLARFEVANEPITFFDGTLLQTKDSATVYVLDQGKKRPIADDDTFIALGYKRSNVVTVDSLTLLNIPTGEKLFMNRSLTSAKEKYLGDNAGAVPNLFGETALPAYVVAEYPSGRIISGKNIDARRPIASLTKLLTSYEALHQDYKLTQKTTYKSALYATDSNPLQYKDGDIISNKDIFYATLVASNNSSARMLAQGTKLDESQFISKITARLEEWGADNTTITDVTGLDEGNKSTARDLLKIFTKVLSDKTIYDGLAQNTYTIVKTDTKKRSQKITLNNTNKILSLYPLKNRNYKVLASKTGYTEEADSLLIMLVENKKDKKQYVVVTMGNPDYAKRFDEPHRIANWATSGNLSLTSVRK